MLEVISDGDFQPYLAEISKLGLTGHVTFRGKLDASGVAAATASAQLLLLFSRYENFPCVIPEALSCGVPVLSTDVGGISEHLGSGEYGMLVPSEDAEGFAAAIDQILSSPERFAPGKLRAYALEHFSKAAVAQAFTGVYHEITASRV
jgi:glycosyltransferase involved in cell wall biosynthesis